jgi:RHH-type rel operon transcriptional repressor/antitoxin RelB
MPKSDVITVRVSPDTKRRLEALAQVTERTQSWLAESALKNYLEDQEWQVQRIQEGIAAADRGEFVEHECVMEWVDSWGTGQEKPMPEPQ